MTDLSERRSNPAVEKAISAIPNLVKLAYRLMRDPRVPHKQKVFLSAALAYVVAPVDLVPDFIPFIGRADDLSARRAAACEQDRHRVRPVVATCGRPVVPWQPPRTFAQMAAAMAK